MRYADTVASFDWGRSVQRITPSAIPTGSGLWEVCYRTRPDGGERYCKGNEMNATMTDATNAVIKLRGFIGSSQLQAMGSACRSEERQWFKDKFVELAQLVETMPKTYEQEGMGDKAIVSLHYFTAGCDWYITERDVDSDGEGQIQAFGYANLGDDENAELGYISIVELLAVGAELDLHFDPRPLGEVRAKQAA